MSMCYFLLLFCMLNIIIKGCVFMFLVKIQIENYFLYHDYNKDEIIEFLEANTSWKLESEEEHFDCLIHNGALYLKDLRS